MSDANGKGLYCERRLIWVGAPGVHLAGQEDGGDAAEAIPPMTIPSFREPRAGEASPVAEVPVKTEADQN